MNDFCLVVQMCSVMPHYHLKLKFVYFQCIGNVSQSVFHDKCFVHMDTLHFVKSKLNLHVRSVNSAGLLSLHNKREVQC